MRAYHPHLLNATTHSVEAFQKPIWLGAGLALKLSLGRFVFPNDASPYYPKIESKESGRGAIVVAQQSAEAPSPSDGMMGQGADGCGSRNSVFEALMITFRVIMHHVLPDCVLQQVLPEED